MGKRNSYSKINSQNKNAKPTKKTGQNPLGAAFFVIPVILLIFVYVITITVMDDKTYIYISPVMKNYTALEKTDHKEMENYFSDEAKLFYDEERFRLINESIEYFYDKTGVRFYLYTVMLSQDENGNLIYPTESEALKTCSDICKELAPEGIDAVLLFIPTPSGFQAWTYANDDVREEFGGKCEKIVKQYLEYNFNVVGEYDELFYYSFRSSADRLMGGFTSPVSLIKENFRVFLLTVLSVTVIIPFVVAYIIIGKKHQINK